MITKLIRIFKGPDEMNRFFTDLHCLVSHFDGNAGTLHDLKDLNFLIDEVIVYLEEMKQ